MATEKSQIKFVKSEKTGDLIGFVSLISKTKKLKGVREDSTFGKKICLLSGDLKGTVSPNLLYSVELKPMHNGKGYVVVAAKPVLFKASIETFCEPGKVYQVRITFGNKTVYFDPFAGKSPSSKTVAGVVEILYNRRDIDDGETVIKNFKKQAETVIQNMLKDGYAFTEIQ